MVAAFFYNLPICSEGRIYEGFMNSFADSRRLFTPQPRMYAMSPSFSAPKCFCLFLLSLVLFAARVEAEPGHAQAPAASVGQGNAPAVQDALQSAGNQANTRPVAQNRPTPTVQDSAALPGDPREHTGTTLTAAVPLQMSWLSDPKDTRTLGDILTPAAQQEFKPYAPDSMPRRAGTTWLRLSPVPGDKFPLVPLVLDLNARVAGQLPGTPQVWLAHNGETSGTPVRSTREDLFPLPDTLPPNTVLYIRVTGLPGPGFAPELRQADSLTLVDDLGQQPLLVLLAVLLFLCLLRGVAERREWRMWAALYIAALLVQGFWGLPAMPLGEVSRWDLPGLLAPGIALLILAHVGRHLMRTRQQAPFTDLLFILLGLGGVALSAAPLAPGYEWTIRLLPLWPAYALLLLPGTLWMVLRGRTGAKRFLLIALFPPLGMLAIVPLSQLSPALGGLIPIQLDTFLSPGCISLVPLGALVISALTATLVPSPKIPPAPGRKGRELPKAGRAGMAAMQLGNAPASASSAELRLPSLDTKNDILDLNTLSTASPAPQRGTVAEPQASAPRNAVPAQQVSYQKIEENLRVPLDALLRSVSALDLLPLSADARYRADALGLAARDLATAVSAVGKKEKPNAIPCKKIFDLNEILLETHDAASRLAEARNIGLSWFIPPQLPRHYEGNRQQLTETLGLLAESAVLATSSGSVEIRVQRLPESTDPGELLFTVMDTGTGMPPHDRSTLGVVRAWDLVGPDAGSLSVKSDAKGTEVSFSVKLTALTSSKPLPSTSATPETDTASHSPAEAHLRIIVTSAQAANRQMLSFYLDELPHEIIEARSAAEAHERYTHTPAALLVFDTDISPEDIRTTVQAIRLFEGEHSLPLAAILALADTPQQVEPLRAAGCTHFLKKPLTRKDLRILALRLAPVAPRFEEELPENLPTETTTAAPFADLPILPEAAPEASSLPHSEKKLGFMSSILGLLHKKTPGKQVSTPSAHDTREEQNLPLQMIPAVQDDQPQTTPEAEPLLLMPDAPALSPEPPLPQPEQVQQRPALTLEQPSSLELPPEKPVRSTEEEPLMLADAPATPPGSSTPHEFSEREPITLTAQVAPAPVRQAEPVARTSAPLQGEAIPDLFGNTHPAPSSLFEEAARLAGGDRDTRPRPEDEALEIQDIVELGTPLETPVSSGEDTLAPDSKPDAPHEAPSAPDEVERAADAGDGNAVEAGEDTPDAEASDEAIQSLLAELEAAMERLLKGQLSGNAETVRQAAASIGRLAEAYDLRVLDDPARCLEQAALSGDMEEVSQLMPDLISAVARNRTAFMEK